MMQSTAGFAGLTMPVFTAFGWAGEEAALKYALSQLEQFVLTLHANLSRPAQEMLPVAGLSEESQSVFLATSGDVESDLFVAFHARPMSFEVQLAIRDKSALAKAMSQAESDLARCHRLITELGPDWSMRLQQMEVDEESSEAVHYQDIFKDSVGILDESTAADVFKKAAYLNGEAKWVTPFYLSRRFPSEQVATMGDKIVKVMADYLTTLEPLIAFLTGRSAKRTIKPKARAKAAPAAKVVPAVKEEIAPDEGFSFVAELKPLHLKRGFINLTPAHWPFFAENSRATTRSVTVYYEGVYDKGSSVWRLLPDDRARIVLSPPVHQWLADNFYANDRVVVTARLIGEDEIQISLKAVE